MSEKLPSVIVDIHWNDNISNFVVLEKAQIDSIKTSIIKHRLLWTGHVFRLNDDRLTHPVNTTLHPQFLDHQATLCAKP